MATVPEPAGSIVATALPALVAAAASLVVALISLYAVVMNARKTRETQAELQRYQRDLKRLQTELDEKQAERNARRDYEYEARKRLYQECSPLLFQLSEQAASAYGRIENIAQAAAQGNLGSGPESWLTVKKLRYYRLSTEYRLLAPLATMKLLQQRLTHLDLSLDPDIRLTYALGRQATRILGDDFELARLGPSPLPYDPHNAEAERLRQQRPAVYWQQGFPRGILDNALEAMLVKEGTSRRVMNFLEYETARKATERSGREGTPAIPLRSERDGKVAPEFAAPAASEAFARIDYLFPNFHPADRPVLWRVLLATAGIYRAIGRLVERDQAVTNLLTVEELLHMSPKERLVLDWRAETTPADQASEVDAAFEASRLYLLRELKGPLERVRANRGQGQVHEV